MRLGALIPALAFGAALLAPPIAAADHHRSPERGRRSGYERSSQGHGRQDRGRRSYRRGHSRHSYKRGHYRPSRRYRPSYQHRRPRHYRPWSRPHYSHRPYPRRYHAPYPAPYGYPGPGYGYYPPYRGGVHGSVSIGLPFIGFSLHF